MAAVPLQEHPPSPSAHPGRPEPDDQGERVYGTITSVGVDRFEIRQANDDSLTVLANDQTHFREGEKELALEDLKPADRVFVRGHARENKQFVAAMVRRITEEEARRFQGSRAFGEITAIAGNELRIRNPWQGERLITLTDQTTLMREGQPIILKDLKVGDRIAAMGHEADGKFIAARVMTGKFRRGANEHPPQPQVQ
jgi:hypothetical protein